MRRGSADPQRRLRPVHQLRLFQVRVTIERAYELTPDIADLIGELDQTLAASYPPETASWDSARAVVRAECAVLPRVRGRRRRRLLCYRPVRRLCRGKAHVHQAGDARPR